MNKTTLWILLSISAALFLYPSVATLLDVLETISNAPAIPTSVIETRDRAVMQVLGFISLYAFLGALLYSYKIPIQQKRIDSYENQPSQNLRNDSRIKLDPQWAFPVGTMTTLALLVAQYFAGIINVSSMLFGVILPIIISIGAGIIIGIVVYLLIYYLG